MKRVMGMQMANRVIRRGWMKVSDQGRGRIIAAEAARHGEEDSDVSDQINEGITLTKIPLIPDSIKEDHLIMEIIPNSMAPSNSDTINQRAVFSEQLEDIDNEISKFDNIQVRKEKSLDSASKGHLGLQSESMSIGPEALGLLSTYDVATEKGLTQKRGWVRKEQNRGEPSGQTSSVFF